MEVYIAAGKLWCCWVEEQVCGLFGFVCFFLIWLVWHFLILKRETKSKYVLLPYSLFLPSGKLQRDYQEASFLISSFPSYSLILPMSSFPELALLQIHSVVSFLAAVQKCFAVLKHFPWIVSRRRC